MKLLLVINVVLLTVSNAFATPLEDVLIDPLSTGSTMSKINAIEYSCKNLKKEQLTLSDLINIALCNNPQTHESWNSVLLAKDRLGKGYSDYLPNINGNIGYNFINMSTNNTVLSSIFNRANTSLTFGISLNYLLYDFGQREANIDSLKQGLIAIGYRHNSVIQNFIFLIVERYYKFFAMQALLDARLESESLAKKSLDNVINKRAAGVASELEELQAESAYSDSQLLRIEAENKLAITRAEFLTLLNLKLSDNIDVLKPNLDKIDSNIIKGNIDEIIKTAQDNHPTIKSARADVLVNKANLTKADRAGLPSLSLGGSFNQLYINSNIMSDSSSHFGLQYALIGVQLSIPIFSGFDQTYSKRMAEKDLNISVARQMIAEKNIALDIWSAYQNCQTALAAALSAEKFLNTALAAENNARYRYKNGSSTLLDLLSAQSYLSTAKQKLIETKYSIFITKNQFLKAIGTIEQNYIANNY